MAKTITQDMTLAEVLEANPLAARVLLDEGLSCVGCSIARMETIEEGAVVHGLDVEQLVRRLNEQLAAADAAEEVEQ